MKVLIVGGGGREHAIAWKLSMSSKVDKIYCAPGNAGIEKIAQCVNINANDIKGLIDFAKEEKIDMTVVGMDDPLVAGIVDEFEKENLRIFGPRKNAAIIEGSKAFSKELMKKYNIPTAKYSTFDNYDDAYTYVKKGDFPVVVKVDGLALGKGVLICNTLEEAEAALKQIMIDKKFGESGNKVVIEEFLTGPEVSVLSFCDGKTIVPMVSAQDHKRAFDNDKGLNTGGMGAFSPSRFYTKEVACECMEKIFKPTVSALANEGREFKGIIFFGLMITKDGPKVIEYNARFGDPETQAVLPILETDIFDIFNACIDQKLETLDIKWSDNASCCVIMASGGYPESYKKGYEITGLEVCENKEDLFVFHAGTKIENGKIVTNGGRVIGVTALGENLEKAVKKAYDTIDTINFKDRHFRKDIGIK